jgi:hypothetical protein
MNIEENGARVVVAPENPLKQMLVDYVGEQYVTEDFDGEMEITVEMITNVLALEFPELIMLMAEENWIRGYQQGIDDAARLPKEAPANAQ